MKQLTNIELGYLVNVLRAEEIELRAKLDTELNDEEREQYEMLLQTNTTTLEKLSYEKERVQFGN